jgi:hypothetical protein
MTHNAEPEPAMFKILELTSTSSDAPTEVGDGFVTREDALAAVKRHLKSFKVSGHNAEERYWWVRDSDGPRRCWISGDR